KTHIWRVGPISKGGQVEDELVFRIQGILSKVNLVPVNIHQLPVNKAINASQQITLTGAGCKMFDIGINRLEELSALYSRYFSGEIMTKWTPSTDGTAVVLSASNRYFTHMEDEPDAVAIAFGDGVDPLGHLQKFIGTQLVHTEANVVKYYKRTKKTDSQDFELDIAFPGNFRVGDIVEIEASVIGFMAVNKHARMHCNLSAITLLDSSFSKVRITS
ncbi:hypothetical protein B0H17DRAFT_914525, partial [Mycena rosella]